MNSEENLGKAIGRPRGFDEDAALNAAMRVFWEKGYEGATMADLTNAMGINRSSLYTAFGDKENLYQLILAKYAAGPMTYVRAALDQESVADVIEGLLQGTVDFLATPGNPKGCLFIQGALACGTEAEPVKQSMIEWRTRGESNLRKRLVQAQEQGDLDASINAADFARYLSTIMAGLGIQAVNGAKRAEMRRIAEMAIQSMNIHGRRSREKKNV